ncbi:MAG: nicotinamide-nucleotide amidohydrolase family protein [Hyphomicrobiaceae bacterium]|nr:nicotinamide-nucleotide amidohydrolase family protein [Hyphomicrobiaceae bacterium]
MAARIVATLRGRGQHITTAESCTGGLVAGALTGVAGASEVFERGFVTYSNAAKIDLLAVEASLITAHGAVSAEVAAAMAEGARRAASADVALAVTGIAGPGGGSAEKPVGLVFMAVAGRGRAPAVEEHRFGDIGREAVRAASVAAGLALVLRTLELPS